MTRNTSPEFADHIGHILQLLADVDDMSRGDIDLPGVDHMVTNALISRMVRNNQLSITQPAYIKGKAGRVAITDMGRNTLLDWRQACYLRANAERIVPPRRINIFALPTYTPAKEVQPYCRNNGHTHITSRGTC